MPKVKKKTKSGWGFKGLKISEEEIERAKNFGDPVKQGYMESELERNLREMAKKAPGIHKIREITKDLPSLTGILLKERGVLERDEHEWVWYPDETSTWEQAGYWRCKKCGLFRFRE